MSGRADPSTASQSMEIPRSRWFQNLWVDTRRRLPLLGFALIVVLIELFYFSYMVSHGMVDKTVQIPLAVGSLPVSIALALALGNAVLMVSLWQDAFERTAFSGLAPDRRIRRILFTLRTIRLATVVLIPFTLLLFLPYILESSWYLGIAEGVASSVPFLRGSIDGFYNWAYGISRVDASFRFMASQLAAAFGTLVVVGLYVWRVRGARGLSRIVRRRRLR